MRDYAGLYSTLLSTLGIEVGDLHCPVTSDMDSGYVARLSLANSFYKKLCPNGNSKSADAAALTKFLSVNERLPAESFEFVAESEADSCFWDYFRDHLNRCLSATRGVGEFELGSIRDGMGIGPGASQLADSSCMHTKLFGGTISYTNPDLIRLYRGALVETGLWCDAEERRNRAFGFTSVEGGKIFFAPKNAEISRTCCTEANLNMLVQMSIGAHLEKCLEGYFGLSLRTQPDINRWLACQGSIHDSFGTMDQVSASDSIGYHMLMRSLDDNFLKAVIRIARSERAVLPDGTRVVLRMVSTMGNGFTFPLQMAIFASAVYAVYDLMGIPRRVGGSNNFGVFGDDVIVVKEAFGFLSRSLSKLGFTVNADKSFNAGVFRESCGHDYFKGSNVRGVYVRSLETPQSVYVLINQLGRWSTLHDVNLAPVINLLRSWVRDVRIPFSELDDAGIKVPFKSTKPSLTSEYWFKYRCYVRRKKRMLVDERKDEGPECSLYELALGTSFLAGHLRRRDFSFTNPKVDPQGFSTDSAWQHDWSVSVALRDKMGARARYQIVQKSLPYWDYWPDPKMAINLNWDDSERVTLTRDYQSAWESRLVTYFPQ